MLSFRDLALLPIYKAFCLNAGSLGPPKLVYFLPTLEKIMSRYTSQFTLVAMTS